MQTISVTLGEPFRTMKTRCADVRIAIVDASVR
jgi:hypothetical protein